MMKANPKLLGNNAQFQKQVVEISPGIWGAIGFAASNVYMVEGESTLTIIDTTETTRAAQNILTEFRKLSGKPIGRIIYTHSHRDHISGATIFSEGQTVPIYASSLFSSDLVNVDKNAIAANKALMRRTLAQFGFGLADDERVSLGCGPGDRPMEGMGAGFIEPTDYVEGDRDIDLDGVDARLIMAPGETADHMVVWLPDQKILFSGDNWYHAFPNLYAIRGTPYRDFGVWAQSLGQLAELQPEVLCPGHTMPVRGADNVQEVLTTTRAAILFVMQTTADGLDAGKSLDDIVADIALPPELADKPWLGEFYGKIGWAVRAFAAGTLGWYDGNPTNLGTLSSRSRAQHLANLAGGEDALRAQADTTDDPQWRLELCDHLTALGHDMRQMKADTMLHLAEDEINATARNTYIWVADKLSNAEGDA